MDFWYHTYFTFPINKDLLTAWLIKYFRVIVYSIGSDLDFRYLTMLLLVYRLLFVSNLTLLGIIYNIL